MKKTLICTLSFAAAAYTVWFMHFGSLTENSGALSKTGLRHPILFAAWGTLTFFALFANGIYIYNRGSKKFKALFIALCTVSFIGMVLTLCFKFDYDLRIQYYLHCAGSLAFSASSGAAVFLIFLINFKKSKLYAALTVVVGIILTADLIFLIIFQESALIEGVPVIFALISMPIVILSEKKAKEGIYAA